MRKRGIPCARRNFFSPLFPWAQTILCSRVGSQRRNKRQKKLLFPLPITRLTHSLLPPLPHSMESSSLDLLPLSQFEINLSSIRPPSPSCLPFHCFIAEETGTDGRADGWTGGRTTTSYDLSSLFPFFPAHTITILPSLLSLLCEVERGLGGWTDLGWSLVGRACVRGLGGGGRGGLSVTASRKGDEP